MKKDILVISEPEDYHAACVRSALIAKGHQCSIYYPYNIPDYQTQSLLFDDIGARYKIIDAEKKIENSYFNAVWFRRNHVPSIPNFVNDDDLKFAQRENLFFQMGMLDTISPKSIWVNPYKYSVLARNKVYQLNAAKNIGLNIPETLVSNDPSDIKKFIKKYSPQQVIYKTFSPAIWKNIEKNDSSVYSLFCTVVNEESLPSEKMLQCVPGIYQPRIDKAFELRVNVFGSYCVAAKIDSQKQSSNIGKLDWRTIPHANLLVEEFKLPESIYVRCMELMNELGLRMGCLDFIVTPDDEYYFLEINEQGQFLWLEVINPCMKMLDTFCEFLISPNDPSSWFKNHQTVSLTAFDEVVDIDLKHQESIHKKIIDRWNLNASLST